MGIRQDLKEYGPEIQYYGNDPSPYMAEFEDGGYVKLEDVQAKIDSGELMVVKTVSPVKVNQFFHGCPVCIMAWRMSDNYCPGCGSKIEDA